MKKLILLGLCLFFLAASSHAQSVDASIGYSYFRLGGSGGLNSNGGSGSIAYFPSKWLGFAGDFGAYHANPSGVSVNTYTYLFGPRFSLHNPTRITPFAQALVGGSRITISGASNSQFAWSFGGGVDFPILPHLAFRPQVDYVGLDTPGSKTNCTRISAGVVVHF